MFVIDLNLLIKKLTLFVSTIEHLCFSNHLDPTLVKITLVSAIVHNNHLLVEPSNSNQILINYKMMKIFLITF